MFTFITQKRIIRVFKRSVAIFIAAAALGTLASCNIMNEDGNDLFKLPRTAGFVTQLQEQIDTEMSQGGEYAAPTSGTNRQSVQLEDLNADGVDEAVVFLRTSDAAMRVCLFMQDENNNYYLHAEAIKEGAVFETVSYVDLDGDGTREILVGRALGSGLPKALSVLSVEIGDENGFREMLSATYSGYTTLDIDDDGSVELVLARHDMSELTGVTEVYRYSEGDRALLLDDFAQMSGSLTVLKRLRTGKLVGGVPAVFVSGETESGSISTDIFAFRTGKLTNITLDDETGLSRETVSNYTIWGSDLDGDGVFDLPMPMVLESYEGKVSSDTFRKIIWRNYDIDGKVHENFQTFHNNTDSWYFIIPTKWAESITVDRRDNIRGASGERGIVFSLVDYRGNATDLLAIYTLTGDNRVDRSELPGRFVISTPQTRAVTGTIYAARLFDLPFAYTGYALTDEQVTVSFKLIQTEWLTGELTN